jgi:hypothetical protein
MNQYGQQTYTYYLYHIPTGKKYYGSRIANKVSPEQDLWNEYFSSSELVEALIKEYGESSFQANVQKTFDTIEEARYWEDRILHKLKAPEKDEWLNQVYNNGPFYNTASGNLHHNYGTTWSEKRRKERSLANSGSGNPMFGKPSAMKGKHHDPDTKTIISNKKKIWWNERRKNNQNFGKGCQHPRYGRPVSESQRKKKYRPIETPSGIFESVKAAALAFSCSSALIVKRCKIGIDFKYAD